MTKHNIIPTTFNGAHPGGHNGEYDYHCTKCGKQDWIASYGTLPQLNFYSTPCTGTDENTYGKDGRKKDEK